MVPFPSVAEFRGFSVRVSPDQTYVSIAAAAAALKISESTCLRRVQRGELRAVVEGGRWRVEASQLPQRPAQPAGDQPGAESSPSTLLRRRLAAMPALLSPEQVAELTGLGIEATRSALRAKQIPNHKVGPRRMVSAVELARWLGVDA